MFQLGLLQQQIVIFFFAGDEILAVNGLALQGMSHAEAISVFKNIRSGKVLLHVARRDATIRRYVRNSIFEIVYFLAACQNQIAGAQGQNSVTK